MALVNKMRKEHGKLGIVPQCFDGIECDITKCLKCNYTVRQYKPFREINLPLRSNKKELEISLLFKSDKLIFESMKTVSISLPKKHLCIKDFKQMLRSNLYNDDPNIPSKQIIIGYLKTPSSKNNYIYTTNPNQNEYLKLSSNNDSLNSIANTQWKFSMILPPARHKQYYHIFLVLRIDVVNWQECVNNYAPFIYAQEWNFGTGDQIGDKEQLLQLFKACFSDKHTSNYNCQVYYRDKEIQSAMFEMFDQPIIINEYDYFLVVLSKRKQYTFPHKELKERIRHFINNNKQKTINEKRYYKDINESLNEYLSPKKINGNEMYFECQCNNKSELIQKELKIMEAPSILLLHLDRFNNPNDTSNDNNFIEGQKLCVFKGRFGSQEATIINIKDNSILIVYSHLTYNHNNQNVTELINKNEYEYRIRGYGSNNIYNMNNKITELIKYPVVNLNLPNINKYKYHLIAVCNHIGRDVNFGHYTAYVKNHIKNEKWYEIDDANIREIDDCVQIGIDILPNIITKNAIALIYKRKEI